jgi:hypothetical protein
MKILLIFVGGPFPCQQLCASILPGLLLRLAGEMPPLREGDRYFWGAPGLPESAAILLFTACNRFFPVPIAGFSDNSAS